MMNRSSSSAGDASFVPSSMCFAGVGGSSSQQTQKQQHFWEWETNSCSHIAAAAASNTTNNNNNRSSFFPSAAAVTAAAVPFQHLDHYFPAPPLLPISPYFASPAALSADYPMGLIKSELDVELSGTAIGLNLGRRTYFSSSNSSDQGFLVDRLFAGSSSSPSSSSSSSIRELPFQYPMFGGGQPPARCQAEGCKADLFRAKHYHRRHKVCEFHSKATVVLVAGLQQRFCQQCSRFHVLAEFDEAKRSCRKRLADHNRRRRKLPLTATTATATTAVDSSIKPKPPQNSSRHNKDRTSMRGPADGFCVGGVEVDKCRAGGNAAAAAMYSKQARGGMAIDDSVSVGEEMEMQQRHCCSSSSSSSRPVVGNSRCSCCFHPHNFFSHETGRAGGGAGQSSTAAASEEQQQQQSHLFQLGQAFFEVDYI